MDDKNSMRASLLKILASLAKGPLSESDSEKVESLIGDVWESLPGSDEGGMTSGKLSGRIEKLTWEPPVLSFQIERHGGTVKGSSRAETQAWEIDTNMWTAWGGRAGHRQLRPQNRPLHVQPLIDETVGLIARHEVDTEWLRWLPDGRVGVQSGRIIPAENLRKETLTGRRKRFAKGLDEALRPHGWTRASVSGPLIFKKS